MHLRPATRDDIPEMTVLNRHYDTFWFGKPENDETEVGEWFDLADAISLVHDDDRLIAIASQWRTGSSLLIDPDLDPDVAREVTELLVNWLLESPAPVTEILDREDGIRAAFTAAGWTHLRSSFDLIRDVSSDWELPRPVWPDRVELRPFAAEHAQALHHLIYVDADWAGVPGHHAREFEEWHKIFLAGREGAELPITVWRGDRMIAAAVVRKFSDGAGWVSQLAVAHDERGRGLGRALLLEALRRHVANGATSLGLSVVATNRGALQLYLGVGLTIDREWQTFARPA